MMLLVLMSASLCSVAEVMLVVLMSASLCSVMVYSSPLDSVGSSTRLLRSKVGAMPTSVLNLSV